MEMKIAVDARKPDEPKAARFPGGKRYRIGKAESADYYYVMHLHLFPLISRALSPT